MRPRVNATSVSIAIASGTQERSEKLGDTAGPTPPAIPASSTSCRLLTADQWAAGPTGVALKQQGPYAYGALVNDLWSVTGDDGRAALNGTSLQPIHDVHDADGVVVHGTDRDHLRLGPRAVVRDCSSRVDASRLRS